MQKPNGSGKMKQRDTHKLYLTTPCLIRRIRERIRECEKYNIDYEEYVEKDNLMEVLNTLDCCISFKDSRKIKRKEATQ